MPPSNAVNASRPRVFKVSSSIFLWVNSSSILMRSTILAWPARYSDIVQARDEIEEDRLHRRQAHSAGADQRQQLRTRRPLGRSDDHDPGDLHRRVVDAGQ